jgi:hypothetical protein
MTERENTAEVPSLLESWYVKRCNGEWEHSWGISIETLDNPGWCIKIGLQETKAANRTLERIKIRRSEDDWIDYKVEKGSSVPRVDR